MVDKIIGDRCTGCSACMSQCPKQAITFVPNSEGFWYPRISQTECVQCNLCINTCPILKPKPNQNFSEPEVYAAWNRNEEVRLQSTSGGVFSVLAKVFIRDGGCVVGARYCDDFTISHCIIEREEDIPLLRQSKYAQSNLNYVFRDIQGRLNLGEKVLFCGTPCQSAGLQSFLGKEYSDLYTCDFICRGVISPKVYRKFLTDLSQKYGSALKSVQFKNKDYGWNRFSTKIRFQNETCYQKDRNSDYYMRGYLKHNLYLRPSCHNCQFKSFPRISDISLGDFWGIGNYQKTLDADKGTSVILVNTEKGNKLFVSIRGGLEFSERTLDEVLAGNSCLLHSAPEGEFRTFFFQRMDKIAFDKLIEMIDYKSQHLTLKEKLSKLIRKIVWR